MLKEFSSADVVIMAGGRGSRLGALSDDKQKCLFSIDEKPMLGHVLDGISEALGSANVTICVAYKANDVIAYVNDNASPNLHIQFLHDEGLSKSANLYRSFNGDVRTPFLAVAGDVIVEPRLLAQTYEAVLSENEFAVVTFSPNVNEVDSHPVAKILEGRVIEYLSIPPQFPDLDHLREMNVRGVSEAFQEYTYRHPSVENITHVMRLAVEEQLPVSGIIYDGRWIHVAYPADLQKSMK
jgi:NDP-sugar pyrophosphorylase family protein